MIRSISAVLARAQRDERGMVLGNVLIFGTVMMLLVATMIAVSTSGAVKAASDRNFQNAMAAAYAGLADYQSKLSNDNGYALYGNPNAQFSKSSGSTFVNADKNTAFTNSGSDWAPVVGSSDQWFRYEVDNSDYSGKGVLRVRVTGKAGGSVRSLVANLKGDGFINYLYFTNYESSNPALTGANCATAYQWQSVAGKCAAVQFAGTDTLNGPIRTNDVFTSACSTVFNGSVEQHDTTVKPSSGTCAGTFNGGAATAVPYLGLPALNTNMSQETRTDLPTTVPRPGCMYTGPTRVKFLGNGRMTVWSPWSRATQIKVNGSSGAVLGADDPAKAAALCGAVSDLQGSAGATISTLPLEPDVRAGHPIRVEQRERVGCGLPVEVHEHVLHHHGHRAVERFGDQHEQPAVQQRAGVPGRGRVDQRGIVGFLVPDGFGVRHVQLHGGRRLRQRGVQRRDDDRSVRHRVGHRRHHLRQRHQRRTRARRPERRRDLQPRPMHLVPDHLPVGCRVRGGHLTLQQLGRGPAEPVFG
ncbi:hypothetical protein WDV91_17715 [Curtobacterium flaccumfaciens pv. flaccumfaciens]